MAYGRLPEPGTEFGPCEGECNHTDCNKTREMAETECGICSEKIGYETNFQKDRNGNLVHHICNLDKIEMEVQK